MDLLYDQIIANFPRGHGVLGTGNEFGFVRNGNSFDDPVALVIVQRLQRRIFADVLGRAEQFQVVVAFREQYLKRFLP